MFSSCSSRYSLCATVSAQGPSAPVCVFVNYVGVTPVRAVTQVPGAQSYSASSARCPGCPAPGQFSARHHGPVCFCTRPPWWLALQLLRKSPLVARHPVQDLNHTCTLNYNWERGDGRVQTSSGRATDTNRTPPPPTATCPEQRPRQVRGATQEAAPLRRAC